MMGKTGFYFSMLVLGLAFATLLYVSYLYFYPFKWIRYYNDPFPIQNKIVKQGDPVVYTIVYCRWNDQPATFSKDLIGIDNPNALSLPSFESSFGAICAEKEEPQEVVINSTVIPEFLPPGKYYMKMQVQQQINPLRKLYLTVTTEPFTVIPK